MLEIEIRQKRKKWAVILINDMCEECEMGLFSTEKEARVFKKKQIIPRMYFLERVLN